MFSAMPKNKCKKGVAARPACVRRSARSVRAPARLVEEAPPEMCRLSVDNHLYHSFVQSTTEV